ncbi:MAG: hypothetical protein AAF490_31210 [Chloroflexota bacterium]
MAIPPIATIRCSPKEIKATESYRMKMDLVSNIKTETIETSGKIEIKVPYDGNSYVTKRSTKDLSSQWQYKRLPRRSRALIGYLNLKDHTKTDLDVQYGLSLHNDVIPLDIALKERGLQYLEGLVEDKFEQVSEIKYLPNNLHASPLSLEFFISDEIYHDEFEQNDNPKLKNYLSIGFNFILASSPAQMKLFGDEGVELLDFRMDWMTVPTTERISAVLYAVNELGEVTKEETAVSYDAEAKQLVCAKLPLLKNEQKNQYHNTLMLQVPEPMAVYKDKLFSGTAQFKYPFLLSGLKLNYYQTNGQLKSNDKLEIKKETRFFLEFRLGVRNYFKSKRYVPSQLFHFPRVLLTKTRVEDIKLILEDERFTNIRPIPTKNRNAVKLYAEREEGMATLRLQMRLIGHQAMTEREKIIPGDEKFTTKFPTGGFKCHIKAELSQDYHTVVNVISRIHARMKQRFHHVTVID